MRLFLSPVGTSTITNFVKKQKLEYDVYSFANLKKEEYEQENLAELNKIAESLKKQALNWSIDEAKKASAELNGLLSFDTKYTKNDLLYFVVTDTYQSNLAFEVVNTFLKSNFDIEGQKIELKSLTTKNKHEFVEGIKELLRWVNQHLPGYIKNNYSVYFNLTGGFKSLLGYLTPVGMFYANSIFYIFETGELIEIPKLPITIDYTLFESKAKEFLLMDANYFFTKNDITEIPVTLLDQVEEDYFGLSLWGELMWSQAKKEILTKELISLPALYYEPSFKNDFNEKNTNEQRIQLQETLAKVSCLLLENNYDISALKKDHGLRYENCKGKKNGKTIGHFRYNQAQRVSCIAEKNGLTLLRNGFHDVCD
ncbi:MAG: hypothetical protein Kow0068_19850 [Marinilabiliales bacterium]